MARSRSDRGGRPRRPGLVDEALDAEWRGPVPLAARPTGRCRCGRAVGALAQAATATRPGSRPSIRWRPRAGLAEPSGPRSGPGWATWHHPLPARRLSRSDDGGDARLAAGTDRSRRTRCWYLWSPGGQTGGVMPNNPTQVVQSGPDEVLVVTSPEQARDRGRGRRIANRSSQPAKVMRIGSMIKQLLEEVRQAPLDEASRSRLREIYDTSVTELSDGLSPDLRDELARMASPFAARRGAERRRTAGGAGPTGGLAGRLVPRYSGHPVRPADGGPGSARAHAPAQPPGRCGRPARTRNLLVTPRRVAVGERADPVVKPVVERDRIRLPAGGPVAVRLDQTRERPRARPRESRSSEITAL